MTTISPLCASDRSEWGELWEQYLTFYESELDPAVTEDVFARLVAGDGYLEDLFVAPDVRGGGVGSALIAQVRTAATDAGAHKVYWLTQSGNATARRLYDSLATDTGFVHYQMEL